MTTDLRVLLRGFVRSPGFTALAVISLALGIGLNTAVFSLVNALFWQSIRGVPEPHRIVFGPRVSSVELARLRDGATTLEGLAGVARVPVQIAAGEVSVATVVPAVSEDYFPALHVAPRLGRLFDATLAQPGADTRVAVLDHRFWRDQMESDPGVIGRAVTLNGHPFTIAGVAPDGFHGAGPERPPLWVPLSAWPLLIGQPAVLTDPAREDLALIGRLRDGQSLDDATAELNLLRQRAAPRESGGAAAARPRHLTLSAGRERWTAEPSPEKRVEFLLVTVVPLVIVVALVDCLLERGQPAAGARRRPAPRDRDRAGHRRQPPAHRAAPARRDAAPRARGRRARRAHRRVDAGRRLRHVQPVRHDRRITRRVGARLHRGRVVPGDGARRPRAGARGLARRRLVGPQGRGQEPHRERPRRPFARALSDRPDRLRAGAADGGRHLRACARRIAFRDRCGPARAHRAGAGEPRSGAGGRSRRDLGRHPRRAPPYARRTRGHGAQRTPRRRRRSPRSTAAPCRRRR